MQVVRERDEGAVFMAVEPQGFLDRGDEGGPFLAGVNALAGMRVNRPTTWSPRGPTSRAPRSMPIPEDTKVAGSLRKDRPFGL